MNNLANLYKKQGRYEEAEPFYLQCLEGRRVKLGADHSQALQSEIDLADVHKALAKNAEWRPQRSVER